MDHTSIAKATYHKFSFIEGNEYIASEFALITILRLVEDFNVRSVLEVGLGIGSISDSVFHFAKDRKLDISYTGTEANEYCLESLPKNVDDYAKIDLYSDLGAIPDGPKFDLIIIDGSDDALKSVTRFCKPDTIIYIEGFRGGQVDIIKQIFPGCMHVQVISDYKNPAHGPFSPAKWTGGGQLIFISPGIGRKLYWFKEKVATYIKRYNRKGK